MNMENQSHYEKINKYQKQIEKSHAFIVHCNNNSSQNLKRLIFLINSIVGIFLLNQQSHIYDTKDLPIRVSINPYDCILLFSTILFYQPFLLMVDHIDKSLGKVYHNIMKAIIQILLVLSFVQTAISACNPYCTDCRSSTNTCRACQQGYYLYRRECFPCKDGCLTCSNILNQYRCLTCSQSQYVNMYNQTCSPCSSECQTCIASNICTSCPNGFNLTSMGRCISKCPNGCLICATHTSCQSCTQGYFLTEEGSCSPCSSNCATCTSNKSCQACNGGYYLSNESCLSCPMACRVCSYNKSCLSCANGYKLSSGVCTIACLPGCATCLTSTTCTTCTEGYYFSIDVCLTCPRGCTLCSNSSVCSACSSAYRFSNGTCQVICSNGCAKCTGISTCSTCQDGYYPVSGYCQNCSYQCKTCRSLNNCTSCINGYYLSNSTCRSCPTGCSFCTNASQCITCDTNYVKNKLSICIVKSAAIIQSTNQTTVIIIGVSAGCGGILLIIAIILIYKRLKVRPAEEDPAASSREILGDIHWKNDEGGRNNPQEECSICQLGTGNLLTKCGHWFHPICLSEWGKRRETCPLCRRDLKQVNLYCQKCSRLHFELKFKDIACLQRQRVPICQNCQECQM